MSEQIKKLKRFFKKLLNEIFRAEQYENENAKLCVCVFRWFEQQVRSSRRIGEIQDRAVEINPKNGENKKGRMNKASELCGSTGSS